MFQGNMPSDGISRARRRRADLDAHPEAEAFRDLVRERVGERVPMAFALFVVVAVLSAAAEWRTFPARRLSIVVIDAGLVAMIVIATMMVRRRRERSVAVMIACANIVALTISAYHGMHGASGEWCLLILTAHVTTVTLMFPWGWRAQAAANLGASVGYPLAIAAGAPTALPHSTGFAYLATMVTVSTFGAWLIQRLLLSDFRLTLALRRREARLQTYLDQAVIGVAMSGPDGRWIEVNDEFCRIVGTPRHDLIGRDWAALGATRNGHGWPFGGIDVPGGIPDSYSFEGQVPGRNGGMVHTVISGRVLRSADGRIEQRVEMVQDISDRIRTEAKLKEAKELAEAASRAKSDFLASISHELRTPMNVILGMTDMALDSQGGSEQREYLRRARIAGETLLLLVNDVLDFSKMEAGKVGLISRAFDLRSWLERTVEPQRWFATQKGLDVTWSVAEDVPARVVGDPDRLGQVLVNLVANGVKFTKQGAVTVRVERAAVNGGPGSTLHFIVADTGIGIPESERLVIFDAFVQGAAEASNHRGGTGLGLAICSRLVGLMGGEIWLDSAVGRGSRFHFTARVESVA
jgi:PAS domain S-box-containing protein